MRGVLFLTSVLVASGLAGCLDESNEAPDPGMGPPDIQTVPLPEAPTWRSLADSELPRAEHCVANVEGTFYIVGGYIIPQPMSAPGAVGSLPVAAPTQTVEIYDANADSWTSGPDYPNRIDHCNAIGHDGWVYVFHGTGNHHKLDPSVNEWVPIADSPGGHNYGGIGVIDGKIYLAAGSGSGSEFVDVYDPATDTWTNIAVEIPTRRGHAAGAVVHGKLYVIGGDVSGHSVNTDANQEFDPATNQWTNRSVLPVMRGSLHAFSWFGHAVVMGGQDGSTNVPAYDDVHAYDPVTDTWTELPSMPEPRHGFSGAVWNDRVYVFAGAPQQGVSGFTSTMVLEPGA